MEKLAPQIPYWQTWDLLADPFAPSEKGEWYFSHPEWEHQLDILQHLLFNSNTVLAVVGDFSDDVSMFYKHLLEHCEPDSIRPCHITNSATLRPEELPKIFAENYGVPTPDNENLGVILENQLTELQFLSYLSCIVITEADNCPPDTLKTLINLIGEQSENQMHLHIILTGTPALKNTLTELFKQLEYEELLYLFELKALTREQTKQYLQNRIIAVGGLEKRPFSEMEIVRIHKQSGGQLSKIHALSREILVEKSAKLLKKSGSPSAPALSLQLWRDHQKTIIGGSILLTALLIVSYISNAKFPTRPQAAKMQGPKLSANKPQIHYQAQAKLTEIPAHFAEIQPAEVTRHSYIEPAIIPKKFAAQNLPAPIKENFPLQNPEHNAADSTPLVATPSFLTAIDKDRAHLINTDENTTKKFIAHGPKVQLDTSPLHYPIIVAKSQIPPIPLAALIKNSDKYILKEVSKDSRAKLSTVSSKMALTVDEEQLLKLSKRHYTLQIIAVSKKSSKQELLQTAINNSEYRLYRTKRQDALWYVAVYGEFRSAQEARAAIKKLPINLQQNKPWPKLIEQVHKEIRTL
jgi:septal ring-binding cell division protein DamX/type II secretory pathway predicted ATPase ExeA